MKPHPIIDNQFSFSGDKIHIDLIMTATDSFGLALYSLDENTTIHIEVNGRPAAVQEIMVGLQGQDSQDLITSLRTLLTLIDEGTA